MRRRVLDRLAAMGMVDDGALAAAVVSSRRASAYGRLRIESDLDRLEVDPAAGASVAATSAEAEVERARLALERTAQPGSGAIRPPFGGRPRSWPGAASMPKPSQRCSASTSTADPAARRLRMCCQPLPNRPALVYDPC